LWLQELDRYAVFFHWAIAFSLSLFDFCLLETSVAHRSCYKHLWAVLLRDHHRHKRQGLLDRRGSVLLNPGCVRIDRGKPSGGALGFGSSLAQFEAVPFHDAFLATIKCWAETGEPYS
jgi:hypothetical protein